MKRKFTCLIMLTIVIISTATFAFFVSGNLDFFLEQFVEKRLYRTDNSVLSDPGIHLIMAGTGTPSYDPIRNPVCVAVIAAGEFLLFDTGDGCTKTLDTMNLPILEISKVFLTHFHSDHINDLGQLINHTWIWGRKEQIDVYGPPGVDNVVDGFAAAAKEDIQIRAGSHALFPLDPKLAIARSHEFTYPKNGNSIIVWQKNGIKVKAFRNDHADVKISCGYRIEYANRSIVISGDTIKSDFVIQNSKNADILVHEVMNREMVEVAAKVLRKNSNTDGTWKADHITQVAKHHTDTLEVAEVAKAAGVAKLILYHVGPGIPDNWLIEKIYTKGMADIYTGPIVISKDKDRFYLEPSMISSSISY